MHLSVFSKERSDNISLNLGRCNFDGVYSHISDVDYSYKLLPIWRKLHLLQAATPERYLQLRIYYNF